MPEGESPAPLHANGVHESNPQSGVSSPKVAKSGNFPEEGDAKPGDPLEDDGGASPGRAVEQAGVGSRNRAAGGTGRAPEAPPALPDWAMGLGAGTWLWWALRVVAVQQRLLRNRSASLKAAASALIPQVRRLPLVSDASIL